MAEHRNGEMDITAQEKTFHGFVSFVARAMIAILIFLLFLAFVGA